MTPKVNMKRYQRGCRICNPFFIVLEAEEIPICGKGKQQKFLRHYLISLPQEDPTPFLALWTHHPCDWPRMREGLVKSDLWVLRFTLYLFLTLEVINAIKNNIHKCRLIITILLSICDFPVLHKYSRWEVFNLCKYIFNYRRNY